MELVERFINYCKIDTESNSSTHTTPSTMKQYDLANLLVKELKEIGVDDAYVNDKCIVYGHLKANYETKKRIGFIAHMDTSEQMSGKDCKPRIIENYDGKDIILNKEKNIVLSPGIGPGHFSNLNDVVGKTLIVTDGNSLLGADDKAGIAEIMDMLEYLHEHPEYKHCGISIAFTPDEEIGEGALNFDIKEFDADYAYTVDGGEVDNIEYENFNAASATIKVQGISVHPGSAKDRMINAALVAMEFNELLPKEQRPECTEGYEGFNHLTDISGDVENCTINYIIRNHDKDLLNNQKEDFYKAQKYINDKYGSNTVEVEIVDTYSNMKELILPHIEIVDNAKRIIAELGLEPKSKPIRGGTDGAVITYKGLPCPNLGTGGRNYHGKYEYAVVEEMKIASELLKRLVAD